MNTDSSIYRAEATFWTGAVEMRGSILNLFVELMFKSDTFLDLRF